MGRVHRGAVACFHASESYCSCRKQWLQLVGRLLPIRARAKFGGVRPRKESGETEQRVSSEEAIFTGWRRVYQQVDIWVPTAKVSQRASIATAKDADLGVARVVSVTSRPSRRQRCPHWHSTAKQRQLFLTARRPPQEA